MLELRGRRSALFPPLMLGFLPRDLPGSALEENARPIYLVGLHYIGNLAARERTRRQALGSLPCFLRLYPFRLAAVPPAVLCFSFTSGILFSCLLDHGRARSCGRVRGGL